MHKQLYIILIFVILFLSFKKDKDPYVKYIDSYKTEIDLKKKKKLLTEKKYLGMSYTCSGPLKGYYLNDKLVLIRAVTSGNDFGGYADRDFYIKNDSLLFVTEIMKYYKEPDEAYVKKHTNKNGDVDYTRLALEISSDNIYYFSDTTIIDFQLKEFGKPKRGMEDEMATKRENLFRQYKAHVTELIKRSNE